MSGVFTGIVKHVGRVVRVASTPAGKRLRIEAGPLSGGLSPGASLSVDGVCLTAVAVAGTGAEFDVVPETLARSTLGELTGGAKVNLEPALPAGGPMDGHIVQGHVDGLAKVARVQGGPGGWVVHFSAGRELTGQMVAKGSIALAGVSLTLTAVSEGEFSVALIPVTLSATRLGDLRVGDRVNVELDIIGKYVRRHVEALAGEPAGLTLEKLRRAGFV